MIEQFHREQPGVSVRRLCAILGINRAWYDQRRHQDERRSAASALRDAIEQIVLAFPGYGYRRVTHALVRDGWTINHKNVLRILRDESLLCQLKQRFVLTTDARHSHPVYPNRLVWISHCDQTCRSA